MIIVSEAIEQSHTASFTCVLKVIDCIMERMPLLSCLQCIFNWSDGYSAQFHSRFTFVLLTHLHPDKDIQWNYNEATHGKGPTIKDKDVQQVKSGRIVIESPKKFAMHASRLIKSIITLYLLKKDIFAEPAGIENAPYTKDTLDVHKVKRKRNDQGIIFLKF